MQKLFCCRCHFSLRTTVMLLITSFIVFFGIVCTLALVISNISMGDISSRLTAGLHDQVKLSFDAVTDQPKAVAQLLAKEFVVQDEQKAHHADMSYLFRYMYPYSLRYSISGIYIAGESGFITSLMIINKTRTVYASNPPNFVYKEHAIAMNTSDDPAARYLSLQFEADHQRVYAPEWPWYVASRDAGTEGQWCPIFVSASRSTFALAYSVPILRHNGSFYGMAVADYTLERLAQRLYTIPVGKTGFGFVVDGEGNLVASGREDIDPEHKLARLHVSNATDAATRAAGAYLEKHTVKEGRDYEVSLAGQTYFLSVSELHMGNTASMDWKVVILIPRADYFTSFDLVTAVSSAVLAAVILFSILAGLFCSQLIARRLGRIVKEIDGVVQYHEDAFDSLERHDSAFAFFQLQEIEAMEHSVSRMKVILQSFEKYIPTQLLRYLIRSNKPASLGLERATATVMFVDVVNFTALMEETRVSRLIEQFTEYNNEVIRIIVKNHGTLDKMMGDGLMAFFGCPPTQVADHETWACRAALQIQRRLAELRLEWESQGHPALHVRVGLASGSVSVGNVGSTERFQYTVLGDIVNLASRMEGLNKFFGTEVLVTHSTWDKILPTAGYIGRLLATVRVKGRHHTTRAYEIVTTAELFDSEARTGRSAKIETYRPRTACSTLTTLTAQTSEVGDSPTASPSLASPTLSRVSSISSFRSQVSSATFPVVEQCILPHGPGPQAPAPSSRAPSSHAPVLPLLTLPPTEEDCALPHAVVRLMRACEIFTRAVKKYEKRRFREAAHLLRMALAEDTPALRAQVRELELQTHTEQHLQRAETTTNSVSIDLGSLSGQAFPVLSTCQTCVRHEFQDASADAGAPGPEDLCYGHRLLARCEELAHTLIIPQDWSPIITMTAK